jgi:hypothetical protein
MPVPTQNMDTPVSVNGQNPYAPAAGGPQPVQAPAIPAPAAGPDLAALALRMDPMIATIEKLTGLTRRDIFLNILKSGVKGNGVSGFIDQMLGMSSTQQNTKFDKMLAAVKTVAIWLPVFAFLSGLAVIGVVLLYKLAMHLAGV